MSKMAEFFFLASVFAPFALMAAAIVKGWRDAPPVRKRFRRRAF